MSYHPKFTRFALATGLFLAASRGVFADSRDDEIRVLREQIEQLDQKLRVLERKQEIRDEEAAAAAKGGAKVTATDKSIAIASGDGANALRIRGLVQADSRWFFHENISNNDAFVLRRARLILEGTFAKNFDYQIVPEFGGTSGNGTLTLLDANLSVKLTPALQVRFGRFKAPVGLEQLQNDAWAYFAERSLVSQFVPNRDLGVQLGGELLGGRLTYAAGVFNGSGDGVTNSNNTDTNDDKDVDVRVFAFPFKGSGNALEGLGIGAAGTLGHQNSQNGATGSLTSGYRTAGQQTWFAYRSTVVAQGDERRFSPQAYYYRGPFGALAEYVVSSQEVANGANRQTVRNKAWQVSGGYVFTGEDASYNGVVPRTNFSVSDRTWGAFEVVARYENARIDDHAFVGGSASLANANTAAREATGWDVGLNWYLTKAVRASFDYFHTRLELAPGAAPGSNAVVRQDENAFVSRFQLIF